MSYPDVFLNLDMLIRLLISLYLEDGILYLHKKEKETRTICCFKLI